MFLSSMTSIQNRVNITSSALVLHPIIAGTLFLSLILQNDNFIVASSSIDPQSFAPGTGNELVLLPVPSIPSSNFVRIARHNEGINGQYVIDPDIEFRVPIASADGASSPGVPHFWSGRGQAPITPFAQEPNLSLESHNGSVSADVWILERNKGDVPPVDSKLSRPEVPLKIFLDLKTHSGGVSGKIVSIEPLLFDFSLRS